jgi:hypothetical protein
MFRTFHHRFTLYERTIAITMGGLVVSASLAYLVFLVMTVIATSEREMIDRRIDVARGEVAAMEKTYVELSRSITVALAAERGFTEVAPRYASDDQAPSTLSIRGR